MPAERLLSSYVMRVLIREGKRLITVHNLRSNETITFSSYQEILEYLNKLDDAQFRQDGAV